jgi:hypothetical protein
LRAGLSQAERQRLEALDRNDQDLQAALDELAEELESQGVPDGHCDRHMLLIDGCELDLLAGRVQRLAEAAGEVSLRIRARLKLMGGEQL